MFDAMALSLGFSFDHSTQLPECNRIMVAFYEGNLEETLQSILRTLRSGCRIERRSEFPSTAQLLLDGLDWQVELLIT